MSNYNIILYYSQMSCLLMKDEGNFLLLIANYYLLYRIFK